MTTKSGRNDRYAVAKSQKTKKIKNKKPKNVGLGFRDSSASLLRAVASNGAE
jgi:hypothetical protein